MVSALAAIPAARASASGTRHGARRTCPLARSCATQELLVPKSMPNTRLRLLLPFRLVENGAGRMFVRREDGAGVLRDAEQREPGGIDAGVHELRAVRADQRAAIRADRVVVGFE